MLRKLEQRIEGYIQGGVPQSGLKYRLAKILLNGSECMLNGKPENIKSHFTRELTELSEILNTFKEEVFDSLFNEDYPLHPKYSIQLSSSNMLASLNPIAGDLARGNFNELSPNSKRFLRSLDLLDPSEYPDVSQSKIAQRMRKQTIAFSFTLVTN